MSTEQDSVQRLAEIRERAEKATPGPWVCLRADHPESAHDRVSIPVTTPRGMLLISANGLPATGEMRGLGSFIAHSREDVPYLLSLIDSLTAERDETTNVLLEQIKRKEFFIQKALADEARAEAAEAEVKRLREALDELLDNFDWTGTGTRAQGEACVADFFARYPTIAAWRDAALATPPSEGGAE